MTTEEFRDYILFKLMDIDLSGWNYVAVDHDGWVYVYTDSPKFNIKLKTFSIRSSDYDAIYGFKIILDLDELGINWTDTLVKL